MTACARRSLLQSALKTAITAASPAKIVRDSGLLARLKVDPPSGRAIVFALGKGAIGMAEAMADAWPLDAPLTGLVIAPKDHTAPPLPFALVLGSHPRADVLSAEAGRHALALMATLQPEDRLLVLLSGGGSALASFPVGDVSIREFADLIDHLMRHGADIAELNVVRKHLGKIGGGKLALAGAPQRIEVLALSDVPGDTLDLISSGPFCPDPSTLADARLILSRYGAPISESVAAALADLGNETPKCDHPAFEGIMTEIVPSGIWIGSVIPLLERAGYPVVTLGAQLHGEARDIARLHANAALDASSKGQKLAIVSGGEATVTVRGNGYGGPSAEAALWFADLVQGHPGILAVFADTDGIDGPTTNAGAVVHPATINLIEAKDLCLRQALANSDAASVFDVIGDAVVTGPTGTNVNDFRVVLVN